MLKAYRWLIGCLFLVVATVSSSAQDPIGWQQISSIPATTNAGDVYSAEYIFTNNLPFTMPTPLTMSLNASSGAYSLSDGCSGKKLAPQATCTVYVVYSPTQEGASHYQLSMTYGSGCCSHGNVVPLPVASTVTQGGVGIVIGRTTKHFPPICWETRVSK